ncbi:MAG: hypothetical protein AABX86_01670 [Nanoarchaeota archaeon]
MLTTHQAWEKLQADPTFQEWKKANPKSYLYVFFTVLNETTSWEVGFFNPKEQTAASFLVGETVEYTHENSKIFKPNDQKVHALELKKIKIGMEEALNVVEAVCREKYAKETPAKKIIILQHLKKPTWNITYLTTALNVLNVKINASNGMVLEDSLVSALAFNQAKQKAG